VVLARALALTRFANNAIHQNVAEASAELRIRVVAGKRVAAVWTNRLDADGIAEAAGRASELARIAPENPRWAGLPAAQPGPAGGGLGGGKGGGVAGARGSGGRHDLRGGRRRWPARGGLRLDRGERGRRRQHARDLGVSRRHRRRGAGGGDGERGFRVRRPG